MGFVDGLGRLLSGKPVFEAGDGGSSAPSPNSGSSGKTTPRVSIVRAETRLNGPNMQVNIQIKNESTEEIFVDKVRVFGQTVELDEFLRAGEMCERSVYNGPKFTAQNLSQCELQYRKQDGDYFTMSHTVEYGFRDGSYVVDNIKPIGSVRDI